MRGLEGFMDDTPAPAAAEATVSIAPAETVSIAKRDLALLVRAASLFAALFEGEVAPDDIVDEAADVGLTIEADAPEDAEDEVDTYVMLSPELHRALVQGAEIADVGLGGLEP